MSIGKSKNDFLFVSESFIGSMEAFNFDAIHAKHWVSSQQPPIGFLSNYPRFVCCTGSNSSYLTTYSVKAIPSSSSIR